MVQVLIISLIAVTVCVLYPILTNKRNKRKIKILTKTLHLDPSNVKIHKISNTAKEPILRNKNVCAYDLFADIQEPIIINPNETVKISTGLSFEIPDGYLNGVFIKSGISKDELTLITCTDVYDSKYNGEYFITLHNNSDKPKTIKPYDNIAQSAVLPYYPIEYLE